MNVSDANCLCRAKIPEIIAHDFHLCKGEESMDANEVARIFQDAQTQGKQIWYFTAPASVPIEVIQKQPIPLDKIQSGKPFLSHNGDDYTGAFEDQSTVHTIKLLIPSKAGNQYELCEFGIGPL